MKIYSWNVNGLRAVLKKGALQKFLEEESPDILCLQEIKCTEAQNNFNFQEFGYECFWNSAKRLGYSGTAVLVKTGGAKHSSPKVSGDYDHHFQGDEQEESLFSSLRRRQEVFSCRRGQGGEPRNDGSEQLVFRKECLRQDTLLEELAKNEGRILALEFEKFFLVNVYTPNSKPDLSRLELREKTWDPEFLNLLKELKKKKPVITCGDFNAAHEEIDIARPKTNHHSAGFTDEERKGITKLLNTGFVDTFRSLHEDEQRYTWWSHWGHARENNVGWRIDYFFISSELSYALRSAEIHENIFGSDHCPVSIEMEF